MTIIINIFRITICLKYELNNIYHKQDIHILCIVTHIVKGMAERISSNRSIIFEEVLNSVAILQSRLTRLTRNLPVTVTEGFDTRRT
jgi:hypothetical protein